MANTVPHTHTKTYTVIDAWTSKLPWECGNPEHRQTPLADDVRGRCCDKLLMVGEEWYAVTQLERHDHRSTDVPRSRFTSP
jgi:hypothetical protein